MQAEVLVQLGLLRPEGLEAARARQKKTGDDLEEAVLALQLLSERDWLRGLARQRGQQYLTTERVADLKIPLELVDRVPVRVAEALAVMPFRLNPDGTLWVLAGRELAADELDQLRKVSEAKAVSQILARRRAVKAAQRMHYYRDPHAFQELEEAELLARLGPLKPPVPDPPQEATRNELMPSAPGDDDGSVDVEITDSHDVSDATRPMRSSDLTEAVHEATPLNRKDDTAKVAVAVSDDVRELARENERLRVAHQLSAAVANLHDLHAISAEFLAAMLDLFAADAVGFALTGDGGAPLLLESRTRQGDEGKLTISSSVIRHAVEKARAVLVLDALADERFRKEESIISRGVRSVVCAPIGVHGRSFGALYVESRAASSFEGNDLQMLERLGEVAGISVDATLMVQKIEDRVVVRNTLRRFFPPELVERSVNGADHVSLVPLRADATLVVARVCDVERLVEQRRPDDALRELDDRIERMAAIVFANGGSLEGNLRAGVSAIFGPPRGEHDHLERALIAVVELAKFGGRLKQDGGEELAVGVATGEMVIGAMGPSARIQLLALGETAELAHRLAAQAKPGEVLATEQARGGRFLTWEEHGTVPSRNEPRPAFRLRWR